MGKSHGFFISMRHSKKIKIILVFILFAGLVLLEGIVYSGHDVLRPSIGSIDDTYARAERVKSLLNIKKTIEEISADGDTLKNRYEIANFLEKKYGLRIIRISGKKILMVSEDGFYIVKINHEEDHAYEKEKVFFSHGYNPLPEAKLFYTNDEAKILIFNNISYDSEAVLLFAYIHTDNMTLDQLTGAMRDSARTCANIHNTSVLDSDSFIYRNQSLEEQEKRIKKRIDYLGSAGYGDILPDISQFNGFKPAIMDRAIILNHGDFSPWNIFVDPWSGQVTGLIDGEASSIGVRSKELAKVVISLIDARKNNSFLIENINSLLFAFFEAYFKECDVDRDAILRSIPYYLASQLLWYAEGTERTFSNRSWVQWRIELCNWALSQNAFDIDKLMGFLENELMSMRISWAGDFMVFRHSSYDEASGNRVKIKTGEAVEFLFAASLNAPVERVVSATNISAELWTNANTGIWHKVSTPELTGYDGKKVFFSGRLLIYEPSGIHAPYEVTARVILNGKVKYVDIPRGNVIVEAYPDPPGKRESDAWEESMEKTYAGVMLDFDGTMKFYDRDVPQELLDVLIDMLQRGIPLAISSSRNEAGGEVDEFFEQLRQRAEALGKEFDMGLVHVYLKNGKYGYNASTGEKYYSIFMRDDARLAMAEIFKGDEFSRFLYPGTYWADEHRVTFAFRGGVDREIFARKLNERLEEINKGLSQEQIALYTDDLFEICPKEGTKNASLSDFSDRIGAPIERIVRIGDQGQLYGIDESMLNTPGGFSVFHANSDSLYPLSSTVMIRERNSDATIRILKAINLTNP